MTMLNNQILQVFFHNIIKLSIFPGCKSNGNIGNNKIKMTILF
jgi:hypothetical protein